MKKLFSFVLVFVMLFTACGKAINPEWQEKYDLGMRYLSEYNYEEAILSFAAAIEIDPNIPEAYLGLADAYVYQGDIWMAMDVLAEGYESTGDETLNLEMEDLLERLNLTGQSVFVLDDMVDWGYPFGMTIYDLHKKGDITEEDVKDFEKEKVKHREENYVPTWSNVYGFVDVGAEHGMITGISIDQNNPMEGPRGITLGMSLGEVLNKFCCVNPVVLKYAESFDNNLLAYIDNNPVFYYAVNFDNGWPDRFDYNECTGFVSFVRDNADISLQYSIYADYTESDGIPAMCDLLVDFNDGVVSEIHVIYQYDSL